MTISFPVFRNFSAIISSNIFSCPFSLSSPSGTPYNVNVGAFNVVPEVSQAVFIFFIILSIFCSVAVISTILSSQLLVHSSASIILLLIPSSVLFGEGNGTPLQYSCLENPWMEEPDRLQSMGLLSQTRLSDFTFTFHFHALEKEMATHSSVLAWRIPGTEEPGGLLSMGSHRVGHD